MARVSDLSGEVISKGGGAVLSVVFDHGGGLELDLTDHEASNFVAQLRPPGARKQGRKLDEVRVKHPRAYEAWSEDEELELKRLYYAGSSRADIARELGRQPGAITARLRRLGLID